MAHYVLFRTLRHTLETQLGTEDLDELMSRRGRTVTAESVLETHGLSLTP